MLYWILGFSVSVASTRNCALHIETELVSCEKLLLLFNLAKHIWLPHPGLCETCVALPVSGEFEVKKVTRAFRGRDILLCPTHLGWGSVLICPEFHREEEPWGGF